MALLAEVDSRKLYLGEGHPSLFAWCTHALRLSEPAAYSRITAARAARRYPAILAQLASGDVTLTTVTLLVAHLTDDNHEALLEAARRKSKRDVDRLVASLVPQPDVASTLRRLPAARAVTPRSATGAVTAASAPAVPLPLTPVVATPEPAPPSKRAVVALLAADRYLLKVTLSDANCRPTRSSSSRSTARSAAPSVLEP